MSGPEVGLEGLENVLETALAAKRLGRTPTSNPPVISQPEQVLYQKTLTKHHCLATYFSENQTVYNAILYDTYVEPRSSAIA